MDNYIFDLMEAHDYENIFFCQEKTLGLKAIIAIHDTTLGPAAGGIRMWPYESEAEAIKDVLRLARGMIYKCAAAGASYGGGKCVVIGDPKRDKTEAKLCTLGRFINRLNGLFITGVDVGTTPEDILVIRQETPYAVTVPEAWGVQAIAHKPPLMVLYKVSAHLSKKSTGVLICKAALSRYRVSGRWVNTP